MYALAFLSKVRKSVVKTVITSLPTLMTYRIVCICRINILYNYDAVDLFKTIYFILGRDILQSDWHGGSGGNQTTISLTKDEAIIGVEGSSKQQRLH